MTREEEMNQEMQELLNITQRIMDGVSNRFDITIDKKEKDKIFNKNNLGSKNRITAIFLDKPRLEK